PAALSILLCQTAAASESTQPPPEATTPTSDAATSAPNEPRSSADDPTRTDGALVTPPRLLHFVDAVVAPGMAPPTTTFVTLRLLVEADGSVSSVDVVGSAGKQLDAAARDAALQFIFVPAARGGVRLAARIEYRYEFRVAESAATSA